MTMTDKEIRASYREAKDQEKQIKILAQLNACKEYQIRQILGLPSILTVDNDKAKMVTRLMALNEAGKNDGEIAKELHITPEVVKYWRKKMGLPSRAKAGGNHRKPKGDKIMKKDEMSAATAPVNEPDRPKQEKPEDPMDGQKNVPRVCTSPATDVGWYENTLERQAELVKAYRLVLCDIVRSGLG